ncbi:GLPGLI family protein [Winogradskyella litoriviva]|uniref:GLPGLI family protein n=1 Tax=Winogradskyella litoriviva TaxID=1220182 RepID=A0ABX2E486_9FLAO|nr:GLPGLI family protein [Winogradskyella litoriviva]NRD23309.1 GLPGLI family protein [Winogradskyella litoriviva]
MKTLSILFSMMLLFITASVLAQDFQGVATYKTQRKIDIKMDSTKMNDAMQTKMMEMMKKQFQKTYILTFNKTASLYKQEAELDKPQVGGDGFNVIVSSDGSDILYKNVKDKNYVDQKETMGKKFLIKDSITSIDWKLEAETKYIGEYTCFKATYTKLVPKRNFDFSSNSNKKDEAEEEEKEPEMTERTITAWYTPQIPISNGPAKYQGLPGLILEIHDGKLTIVCSQIIINPESKVEIEEPTKGKEVSQVEYDEIMDKKAKEMMERYAPRKGSNGESISITIGG